MTLLHERGVKNANSFLKGKNRCILSDLYSFIFSIMETIIFPLEKKCSKGNTLPLTILIPPGYS